jgi:hypothetical protein
MPPVPAPATPSSSPVRAQTTQDIRRPGQWRTGLSPHKVAWIEALIALRPLDLVAWQSELRDDPDSQFLLYLVEHGLSLTDSSTPLEPFKCRNYKSAYSAFHHVNTALADDILRQRIFRQYPGETFDFVHALGAVPKTATSVRVIHDHSRPYGRSLNAALSQTNFSFDSVDDAVALMTHKCYMAKVDIEAAYRHVPIDPADWDKLAFTWPTGSIDDLYMDGYLQFGLMNACEVFNCVGRAIVQMMARRGFHCVIVYVDDFILICPDQSTTWYAYWALRALLKKLGFSVNPKPHKLVPPCQIIEFLGVTLDSINMQARLSPSKLAETLELVQQTLQRSSITHRSIERLNGKLNWVCKIVYGGRTFLRRLIDAQWSTTRPHHHIRLSASLRLDLEWWHQFLPVFNGQTELFLLVLCLLKIFQRTPLRLIGTGPSYKGASFPCHLNRQPSYSLIVQPLRPLFTYTSFSPVSFCVVYSLLPCVVIIFGYSLTIQLWLLQPIRARPKALQGPR